MYKRNLGFRAIISLVIICIITSTINFHEIEASISSNLPVSYMDENFPDSYKPYMCPRCGRTSNEHICPHCGSECNLILY